MKAKRKFRDVRRKDKEVARKKRSQLIISVILAVLMILSISGIFASNQLNGPIDEYRYQDQEFTLEQTQNQVFFITEVDKQDIVFYSLPQDVLRFKVDGNLTQALQSDYLVITAKHDPQVNPLYDLMRFDFNRYGGKLVAGGILEPNETVTTPVVTCANATPEVPIIAFINGNKTQINATTPCITVSATPAELGYMRDRLLYSILGIIQR